MTMFDLLLAAGGVTGMWAALDFLRMRAARTWPSAPARVVEVPPQSSFEEFSRGQWVVNRDSDHALVWTVEGTEYRKRVEDRAAVQFAGVKLWRSPPAYEDIHIRYDPRNPGKGLTPEELGAWRWFLAASALFFLVAACVRNV